MMMKIFVMCVFVKFSVMFAWGSGLFEHHPTALCTALQTDNLFTGGWKQSKVDPNEWYCMSSMVEFGAPGIYGLANNIAYYVIGKNSIRVDEIRIKININNPDEKSEAFSRLINATKSLFRFASTDIPAKLAHSLVEQKPITMDVDTFRTKFVLESGDVESYKLIFSENSYLKSSKTDLSSLAGEFMFCRKVVAQNAGYSETFITGDGEPINEDGYRSYLLQGKNGDTFFCEIHSSNRYRIQASFQRELPFKYIDDGEISFEEFDDASF
jgi:hypothetical protein